MKKKDKPKQEQEDEELRSVTRIIRKIDVNDSEAWTNEQWFKNKCSVKVLYSPPASYYAKQRRMRQQREKMANRTKTKGRPPRQKRRHALRK